MDDVVEVFGFDICENAVQNVGNDVEDEAEEDDGRVEVADDVANPDDRKVGLGEAVVVDDVYVVDVVNLLDDGMVEVDEVNVLVDVIVIANIINAADDGIVCDDLNVVVVVADAGKLLLVNDDVDEVGVDHLGDVVC